MRVVFRLQKKEYSSSKDILSGAGAKITGGRWNDKGTPLVYTSSTPEMSVLETLVHLKSMPFDMLPSLVLVTLSIPEDSILRPKIEDLPQHWDKVPAPLENVKFTEKWLQEKQFLAMQIPSAIVPKSSNFLINPLHARLNEVQVVEIEDFSFDKRLVK